MKNFEKSGEGGEVGGFFFFFLHFIRCKGTFYLGENWMSKEIGAISHVPC